METPLQAAARLGARYGTFVCAYEYKTADGMPLFWNLRIRLAHDDKTFRMMSVIDGAYVLQRGERPASGWPLYGLEKLSRAGHCFVCEGEKDVDSLHRLGLPAVTSGSTSTDGDADWSALRGREVVLWPDNDDTGRRYMDRVAETLKGLGCDILRIDPERLGLPEKGDASDWLALHPEATARDVIALIPEYTTASLLEECRRWIHRYCFVSRVQGTVLAAWVLHTWVIDAAECTPYIHITAPEKGC